MSHYFKNGEHVVVVGPPLYAGSLGDVQVLAQSRIASAAATLTKAQVPAFALAVLEAAGYAADNSCAGDAVRSLKYQIANEAGAAEAAALDKEAEALATAGWEKFGKPLDWPKEVPKFKEHWRAVARKARELHKTEVAK